MPAVVARASILTAMPRIRSLLPSTIRVWLLVFLASLVPSVRAETPFVVRVEMREFAFRPSTIRMAANQPVRLVLMNRGQIAHQLEAPLLRRIPAVVYDGSLRVETVGLDIVRLQPGGTATIELYPRTRGRFPFACTIEGHKEAGMVGILEVR